MKGADPRSHVALSSNDEALRLSARPGPAPPARPYKTAISAHIGLARLEGTLVVLSPSPPRYQCPHMTLQSNTHTKPQNVYGTSILLGMMRLHQEFRLDASPTSQCNAQ